MRRFTIFCVIFTMIIAKKSFIIFSNIYETLQTAGSRVTLEECITSQEVIIMKKLIALVLSIAVMLSICLTGSFISSAEATEEIEAVEIANGSTVGTRLRDNLTTIGVSFSATSGFTKLEFVQAWGSNPANKTVVVMELFNFKNSYEETVKGEPVYTRTFTSDASETPEATASGNFNHIIFDLGKVMPAGEYSVRLTLTSGEGTYFVPPSASAKYKSTEIMYTDFVFNMKIYFVKKADGNYFTKFNIDGLLDLQEYELTTGPRDNNAMELGNTEFGVKFVVPEGKKLYSLTIPCCPTWGNTGGGSDMLAEIYPWKGDYDSSQREGVLTTKAVYDHVDGDNVTFLFDTQLPAGEYLAAFTSIGDMRIGFYGGGKLTEGVEVFKDGWETEYTPLFKLTLLEDSEVKEKVSRDQLTVDGADKAKVGGNDELTEIDVTDLTGKELRIWGWYASNISVPVFGYKIDDGEVVYGEYAVEAEAGVKAAAEEAVGTSNYASRYAILVPITEGNHTVTAYVRLSNGERAIWTVKYKNGPDATEVPTAAPTEAPTEKATDAAAPTAKATDEKTATQKPSGTDTKSGGLPVGAVIGIIAGIVVIAAVAVILIFKKKK